MLDLSRTNRRHFLASSAALGGALLLQRQLFGQKEGIGTFADRKSLFVHSQDPLNAEPELADLVENRITPNKFFYVRNHGPIPKLKAGEVRLTIDGLVHKPLELSVEEVQGRHKHHTVEATMTCAGNRREEHSAIKEVAGVQWRKGAIGNATWTGISLADLLKQAGLREGAKHVWFEGLDPIPEKGGGAAPFGGSIPLEKAMSNNSGSLVLVAFKMNGETLLPEHGFPLRTVVPGYIGARSVKWLTKITVADEPSPNHFVKDVYKIVLSDDEAKDRNPIYEFAINSVICNVTSGEKLEAGKVKLEGYALPSGQAGATIAKVEVSADGGRSWREAKLNGGEQNSKAYTWRLWSAEVDLTPGKHQLVVRATDSRGNQQPEKPEWNLKGYMFNAWQRVDVEVA